MKYIKICNKNVPQQFLLETVFDLFQWAVISRFVRAFFHELNYKNILTAQEGGIFQAKK